MESHYYSRRVHGDLCKKTEQRYLIANALVAGRTSLARRWEQHQLPAAEFLEMQYMEYYVDVQNRVDFRYYWKGKVDSGDAMEVL